jgi:hypothetical protein
MSLVLREGVIVPILWGKYSINTSRLDLCPRSTTRFHHDTVVQCISSPKFVDLCGLLYGLQWDSGRYVQMRWWQTTVHRKRDIGTVV